MGHHGNVWTESVLSVFSQHHNDDIQFVSTRKKQAAKTNNQKKKKKNRVRDSTWEVRFPFSNDAN